MEKVTGHMVTELQEGANPIHVFIKGDFSQAGKYIYDSMEMDIKSSEQRIYTVSDEITFEPNKNGPWLNGSDAK